MTSLSIKWKLCFFLFLEEENYVVLLHFLSHGQLILDPSKPRHKEASLT